MTGTGGDAHSIDAYDAALFDLDGVVYLGPVAVPGAADGIAELRATVRPGRLRDQQRQPAARRGRRPPASLASRPQRADVVTSAQAGAHLLWARFGPGARVLAVGGAGVWDALEERA